MNKQARENLYFSIQGIQGKAGEDQDGGQLESTGSVFLMDFFAGLLNTLASPSLKTNTRAYPRAVK